ncbi:MULTISPECIES: hypothetical protein [unclassified Pseudofrankia]|uniref:hypothetical protein n=1 Tax=unclassified Pseudofrankia TaxID=2994372 RepID=UPI0008DB3385|nr:MULTISPECIES: hypothetical protein [unclassified Pseudofrankia]MDT3446666.1 hypothetical protein [Pseudofrankia sp. BMG5.37]OHV47395.1 hypothetical protein BCD48_18720 [Pseudofrankia sp. BMG5.36]
MTTPITGAEAADRLAIRDLVDAYAHCADRRDAVGRMRASTRSLRSRESPESGDVSSPAGRQG